MGFFTHGVTKNLGYSLKQRLFINRQTVQTYGIGVALVKFGRRRLEKLCAFKLWQNGRGA